MDGDLRDYLGNQVKNLLNGLLDAPNEMPTRVKDLLEDKNIENPDNEAWTEMNAMKFIYDQKIGTNQHFENKTEHSRSVTILAHTAVLIANSGYFREGLTNHPNNESLVTYFDELNEDNISWFFKFLYHPDFAGVPEEFNKTGNILPHCVRLLRLATRFQVPKLADYAMENAQHYIDEFLHQLFRAVGPVQGNIYYEDTNEVLTLEEMGVLAAVSLIHKPGLNIPQGNQGKELLQSLVLLTIGIKHRVGNGGRNAGNPGLTPAKEIFQDNIKTLCWYTEFLDLYLEMDVECTAFRLESVLYPKTDRVSQNCACRDHNGGPRSIKRADIRPGSHRYILVNPFNGGRTIYCWNCAGTRGYPWRPFLRPAAM